MSESRKAVRVRTVTPMREFYVLASEDEDFCGELTLGHVTAPTPEDAASDYDGEYEDSTVWRAVFLAKTVTFFRMEGSA